MSNPEWHAAFPSPTATPGSITPDSLAGFIREKQSMKDYLVVDVRRTDFEGAAVAGCLNLPAHSFYQTRKTIGVLLAPVPLVIFYCNSCKPGGRGPRSAGWYQDALDAAGNGTSRAVFLEGGIRAWIEAFGEDEDLTTKLCRPNDQWCI
ncbi:Rhodanese-like domain-containing protein [Mycena maculata]|uniref:Rhodanese-like domain-containing protein n=1 Tax=Mycena maculata TaxID=230809 RepID=A0AAD7MKQ4_9AGAR|nr:Rhodanese-like domain-containing protein [Mycena maculata]